MTKKERSRGKNPPDQVTKLDVGNPFKLPVVALIIGLTADQGAPYLPAVVHLLT
jgi:hypothetical protein